jgi:hypothetical protein
MSTAIEGIEVELGRLEGDWRKFGIKVKAHSQTQRDKGLKFIGQIDPAQFMGAQAVANAVGVLAGALAEDLGKKYGDNIDPDSAARNGIKALAEELMLQVSLGKDAPTKVARLMGHRHLLQDAELELLDRINYFIGRGEMLTPFELGAINRWLGRVHANAL